MFLLGLISYTRPAGWEPMKPWTTPVAAAIALCALLAANGSAATTATHTFPVQSFKLYLNGGAGALPTAAPGKLPLGDKLANTNSLALFIAPGVSLPVNLGIIGQQSQDWVSSRPQPYDMTLTASTGIDLYFIAQVEATALFRVSLYGVAANGTMDLLGEQARQFVTVLSGAAEHFDLGTAGTTVRSGDTFLLRITAEVLSAAVTLQYDGAATPSAIQSLSIQVKDTDKDGIPDSVDPCPTTPDCGQSGVPDGDQPSGAGNSTFYQYYSNHTTYPVPPPPNPLPGAGPAGPQGAAAGAAPRIPEPVASGAFFATGSSIALIALLRRP
jgi:hypothetical protein